MFTASFYTPKSASRLFLTSVFLLLSPHNQAAALYTELGDLGGVPITTAKAISGDGNTIIGTSYPKDSSFQVYRWTFLDGIQQIDTPGSNPLAINLSNDGSVIVGTYYLDGENRSFIWTQDDGAQDIGNLGGEYTRVYAISGNGKAAIGLSYDVDGNGLAFRWTKESGIEAVGPLTSSVFSYASGISDQGDTVIGRVDQVIEPSDELVSSLFLWNKDIGSRLILSIIEPDSGLDPDSIETEKVVRYISDTYSLSSDGTTVIGSFVELDSYRFKAFRWTDASGLTTLGSLSDGDYTYSRAVLVNSDGSVIAGHSNSETEKYAPKFFRWTELDGMVDIGVYGNQLFAMSEDGNTILVAGVKGEGEYSDLYRWNINTGAQTFQEWLAEGGVNLRLGEYYYIDSIAGMSDDGSTISGEFKDFATGTYGAFVARVSSEGSGFITTSDIQNSVNATNHAINSTYQMTSTLINGAFSNPMALRIPADESSYRLFGDWGTNNHLDRSGHLGLYGLTLSKNFNPVQLNLSIGKAWSNQDLAPAGSIENEGTFVALEGIFPLSEKYKTYATISGYKYWGEEDISRGYVNAGHLDYSYASPDVRLTGWRARLDMQDLWRVNKMNISVYGDYNHSIGTLDAYSENSGGFPAAFEKNRDSISEIRTGLIGTTPIADSHAELMLNLEATHRFDSSSGNIQGQIIGISQFNTKSEDFDSNWIKAGIGIQGQIASGKYHVTLNITTQGEMPNMWIAAAYQKRF